MKAILAVIASFLVLLSIASIVVANPTPPNYTGPSSPDTSLPKITIGLPENGTIFNQIDVSYSIAINKPSSWFDYGSWNGQIFSVAYSLDNGAEITIAEKEFDSQQSLTSREPITLQGTLSGLSNGNHTFQVLLYGVSYYQQDYPYLKGVPSNYYIRNNATATFSVDTNLEANVTPTANPILTPTTTLIVHIDSVDPKATTLITIGFFSAIAGVVIVFLIIAVRHRKMTNHS
jgi:hypothetical protein